MKKWVILILCVIFLTGCQTQSDMGNRQGTNKITVTKMMKLKDIRYVALGDSLTLGVGDETKRQGYVGRFKQEIESWQGVKSVTVFDTAKRGRTSQQLIAQLKSGEIDDELHNANIITVTIGGNDLMKIVRANITDLTKEVFDTERPDFQMRYATVMKLIRERNQNAPIILIGVYNPLSIFTKQKSDMNTIMQEWNSDIRGFADGDAYAVYVNVEDLFDSNDNLVYHTDFFHPNAKGYDQMTARIIKTLHEIDLNRLSQGQFDFREDTRDE